MRNKYENDKKERHIWIIGASRGIGRSTAIELAKRGHHIALSSRSIEPLEETRKILLGGKHLAVPCDITDELHIKTAQEHILKNWCYIDMVIFATGIYEPMPLSNFNLNVSLKIIDVNFGGSLRLLNVMLPYFRTRSYGHLCFIGSIVGYSGLPLTSVYGASKAALIYLAESLRAELGNGDIKIQIINPGFVKTRLTQKYHTTLPFLISSEEAACYIADGLFLKKFEIHFPKKMTMVFKFLRIMPYNIYFKIISYFGPPRVPK